MAGERQALRTRPSQETQLCRDVVWLSGVRATNSLRVFELAALQLAVGKGYFCSGGIRSTTPLCSVLSEGERLSWPRRLRARCLKPEKQCLELWARKLQCVWLPRLSYTQQKRHALLLKPSLLKTLRICTAHLQGPCRVAILSGCSDPGRTTPAERKHCRGRAPEKSEPELPEGFVGTGKVDSK